jgi:hypothetical protein
MNDAQFAEAIAGKVEQRDATIRQVVNGFIVMGNRRFIEPTTKALVLQQPVEAVFSDANGAASALGTFLTTGELVA